MIVDSFFLWIILLSKASLYKTELSAYHRGSLSSTWTFNATIFMKPFENGILYVADYERNVMILGIDKVGTSSKRVILKYNKVNNAIQLKSLCGCDPCDETLVNLYFITARGWITLTCNNFKYFKLPQINNNDRGSMNVWMTERYKQRTMVKDRIYIELLVKHVGCLDSFYHNGIKLYFNSLYSKFRPFCPRNCTPNICNEGKCRALQPYGLLCDCSSTARNGMYCNDRLKKFKRESKNSYEIKEDTPEIHFKLTWQKLADEKYCLLQFVHRGGRETLSISSKSDRSYLLKGINILSEIDGDGINFLTVSLRNNNLTIKVNNKIVEQRRVIFGNTWIHVGFTETREQCDTFEGTYDLDFKEYQMRQFEGDATGTASSSLTNGKLIISIIGTAFLMTTLFSLLIIAVKCCRRPNQKENSRTNDDINLYDATLENGKVEFQLKEDEYDSVDTTKIYSEPGDVILCAPNKHKSVYQIQPELPPRKL